MKNQQIAARLPRSHHRLNEAVLNTIKQNYVDRIRICSLLTIADAADEGFRTDKTVFEEVLLSFPSAFTIYRAAADCECELSIILLERYI